MNKIIKSEKLQDLLVVNEYIFRVSKITNSSIRWRCIVSSCTCVVFTSLNYHNNSDNLAIKNIHNHVADSDLVEKKQIIYEMKTNFTQNNALARSTVAQSLRSANATTIQNIGNLQSV